MEAPLGFLMDDLRLFSLSSEDCFGWKRGVVVLAADMERAPCVDGTD